MRETRRLFTAAAIAISLLAARAATGEGATLEARKVNDAWTLAAGPITVSLSAADGTFSVRRGEHTFLKAGRLGGEPDDPVETVRAADVRDTLGAGKALKVTRASGRIETLIVYEGLPFVCGKVALRHAGGQPVTVKTMMALTAEIDAGAAKADLRPFGPEGSYAIGGDRDHYAVGALAHPKTRAGVVCGWLTHHRASGVVGIRTKADPVRIEARSEYGKVTVAPNTALEGETVAIGWFDDCLEGLDAYAAAVAKAHQVRLPKQVPSGYCTWYHARALDEQRMTELAAFCKAHLAKFGFDFLQIDDGWQISGRDFTTHHPKGKYASGMKPTADAVRGAGFTPGIWLIPFGWNPKRPVFKDHQDWFVHREDGSLYAVKWAGTCLDMTHPGARTFLREVVSRITRQWGYKYIKIDGLWTGMAAKIRYPRPEYGPDGLGDAVFHDPSKTNVEAYRSGLKLVREAAGDDVFILGCNIAQNMRTLGGSVGLVDGMRIGPDVGANWGGVRRCARPATNLYYWHGHVWFNDPDCLMLRPPLTLDQARAWASLIALSGQMVVVSEWLPGLAPERLDVLKRAIPNHGGRGRPIDLFGENLATVWHLRADLGDKRRDLVGLFNWDDKHETKTGVDLASLGLDAGTGAEYVGFDYWENAFVGPVTGTLTATLRPSACRVLSLCRAQRRPQLVSTSRHITQGAVDVVSVEWDAKTKTLAGRSRLVGGDPYELCIATPRTRKRWAVRKAEIDSPDTHFGETVAWEADPPWVRVTIRVPRGREVGWRVWFE